MEQEETYQGESQTDSGKTDLQLDMSVLEQHTGTTTSLAGLYGYSVFSEDFQSRVEQVKHSRRSELETYLEGVFVNSGNSGLEEIFDTVMAAEATVIVRDRYARQEVKEISTMAMIGYTVLGALLAGAVWLFIEKKRKERKLREDHNYSR